ncbi:unnamed protein product [Paramecium octaurelia]|uniref:Uncharacterized protein n=1 Tax=Paramecium octaurelia TaxID=43137 RepID=A0A8S1XG01_PAROT|nr:unnamed protein product [Paramecium octaurelia]
MITNPENKVVSSYPIFSTNAPQIIGPNMSPKDHPNQYRFAPIKFALHTPTLSTQESLIFGIKSAQPMPKLIPLMNSPTRIKAIECGNLNTVGQQKKKLTPKIHIPILKRVCSVKQVQRATKIADNKDVIL